jgi:hypothetical protein
LISGAGQATLKERHAANAAGARKYQNGIDVMNIHTCARCDGCGHVTGGYGWEVPWTRWAGSATARSDETGILKAHACPDCGGTGALLEFPRAQVLQLPWGGLRQPRAAYADHVALVLQTQSLRNLAN